MDFLLSILIGVLTGGLGLLSVGFLANACVGWYRVSSREGAAGYFVVLLALLGGLAGCILGFATALAAGPSGSFPAFLEALGLAWGIALLLVGTAAVLARVLADIPPTIDGRELMLEVELRLPVGEMAPPATGTSTLRLLSVVGRRSRASYAGELRPDGARVVDGRAVIPGEVFLFTRRGKRIIDAQVGGGPDQGFLVPLPARPGREHGEWSEWLPRAAGKVGPWPETKMSFRFRVKPIEPPPPAPGEEEVAAARFAGLAPEGPLEGWLEFVEYDPSSERCRAAMAVVEKRQPELARLISGGDPASRSKAFLAAGLLGSPSREVVEAVAAEGREIAEGIRDFNEMDPAAPDSLSVQAELRSRFNRWKEAWWHLLQAEGAGGLPPLVREIRDLALVRARETTMDEIVIDTRAILDALDSREARAG